MEFNGALGPHLFVGAFVHPTLKSNLNPHLPPQVPKAGSPATWTERIRALRNVPPLLRMVWNTSPGITSATIVLRLVSAVIPVCQLWVGKLIIDQVVQSISGRSANHHQIWVLVGYEIGLAVLSDLLSRAINLCDSLLGDKFTNHVSVRLMEHAGQLDLASFEDPVFYDKLERARRQTTARLGMLASLAGMAQQSLTLLSLLSAVPPEKLGLAILSQDKPALVQAEGVGPRLAARIVNELRDKIGNLTAPVSAPAAALLDEPVNGRGATVDAIAALENLGVGRSEALGAIAAAARRLGSEAAADVLIKAGLEELAR